MRRQLTDEEEALGLKPERKALKKKPIVSGNKYAEDWQKRLEEFKKSTYRAPVVNLFRNKFWYVFGYTEMGKPFSDGPFMTKREAEAASVQLDKYELFELKTKNRSKAVSEIKHILIDRGTKPDDALRQQIHSVSKVQPVVKRRKRWF